MFFVIVLSSKSRIPKRRIIATVLYLNIAGGHFMSTKRTYKKAIPKRRIIATVYIWTYEANL